MALIRMRVTPRAVVERISIDGSDEIHVWVKAPAIEGRANRRLVEFLSSRLGVPKSRVTIVKGATARIKTIEVEGMESGRLLDELARSEPSRR